MEPCIAPVTPLDTPLDEPVELDPSAIPEVEHYELDDIPLFYLPMAGSTILTIQFRVGRADEPATREVIEGAGHFPWLDVPDRYWPAIEDFVTRQGSALSHGAA